MPGTGWRMVSSGKVILGTPKTHKRRTVPFPDIMRALVAAVTTGKAREDLVFPDAAGGYLINPTVREHSWLDRALIAADLPSMTVHDLRHTAASLAVSADANVKAVLRMLGHASAAMTLDVYADLFDDDLDDVAVRLNQAATSTDVVKMWSRAPEPGAV
jgi:integrase